MSIQDCRPALAVAPAECERDAELFKALGDPHRLAILSTLARAGRRVCVCDLTAGLPLNQPAVSHHLKVLKDAGLVTAERRGTWMHYALADDARERLCAALRSVMPEAALRAATNPAGGALR
jgi:ArsR family transcriptional regulator